MTPNITPEATMKIFQIDDMEWWIGQDAESVLDAVKAETGMDDEHLDHLKIQGTDEDERPIGEPRTFREQLAIEVAEGGGFPRMFAAEDY